MIHELRIYDTVPGKLPALHDRFANTTLGLFEKHGIRAIAFWVDEVGISNRLTYILEWTDLAERDRVWGAFMSDPEWLSKRAESEKDGPLVARITATLMRPTPYSPMQ